MNHANLVAKIIDEKACITIIHAKAHDSYRLSVHLQSQKLEIPKKLYNLVPGSKLCERFDKRYKIIYYCWAIYNVDAYIMLKQIKHLCINKCKKIEVAEQFYNVWIKNCYKNQRKTSEQRSAAKLLRDSIRRA